MKDHAALLIRTDRKQLLFIRRSALKKTLPNIWAVPSGTNEVGETIESTAVREAFEELGVHIRVDKPLTITEIPEFGARLHFLVCTIISGTPFIKDPNEIGEIEYRTFPEFFAKHPDENIGHGLRVLRQQPNLWQNL